MDGADMWAKTLVQLMAQTKPKDIWELVPQENLASGHLDSSGFQYQLRGLSRGPERMDPHGGLGPKKEEAVLAWAVAEQGPRREPRGPWVPT
ncbi:hypothetical protein E5288_WYG018451 [Bos mutus]|uniref:Uncharacterized protein n=1 Tax=Bos mutus TaxID=72004 RepID=A0A6B0S8T1_9CETA|nr:hypothetical protein [Bos mutus]